MSASLVPSGNEEDKVQHIAADALDMIELAKRDPDILSALSMEDAWEFGWPPVFLSIFFWVVQRAHKVRDFSQLAIGLPRGFGKTTFVKVIMLYCIIFTDKQFFLILSKTKDHATNIISDVMDMLLSNNMQALFGNPKANMEIDRADLKRFHFRGREIVIGGLGEGGNVRGFNIKHLRPDFILFDDIQSREDADSEKVSRDLKRWMLGTAMKAKSPKGCLFCFLANMYPTEYSLLKQLKTDPYWEKYIAGGILQDPATGELSSLWEELQPLEQLLTEYAKDLSAGEPEIFMAEVMNDENASVNTAIDTSKITKYLGDEHEVHQGNFIVIDPATDKERADLVSVGYFQVHDAVPVQWDLLEGKLNPGDTIKHALHYAAKYACGLIFVEGGAYQSTLKYWFDVIMTRYGIEGITVVEIVPGKSSKNSRIMNMFKQLTGGQVALHPRTVPATLSQIVGFDPLKTKNNDGILDLLTYAPIILTKHSNLIRSRGIIDTQESEALEYMELPEYHNSPF